MQKLFLCLWLFALPSIAIAELSENCKQAWQERRQNPYTQEFQNKYKVFPVPKIQSSVAKFTTCLHDNNVEAKMNVLEQAVDQAILKNPVALKIATELNQRLLVIFNAIAATNLQLTDVNTPTPVMLNESVDKLLIKYFGGCPVGAPGCVGNNPIAIREIFNTGNLRERMSLTYLTTRKDFFPFCNDNNASHAQEIFAKELLKRAPTWGKLALQNLLAGCTDLAPGKVFLEGKFTLDKFRKPRPGDGKLDFEAASLNPPLSTAECNFIKTSSENCDQVRLEAGMARWIPTSNMSLPYFQTAKYFGFTLMTGPSGTTDRNLHLGCILGLDTLQELEEIRLAAFANLSMGLHHSALEILVGSKSYLPNTVLTPAYYKTLYNFDPNFAKSVEAEYRKITLAKFKTAEFPDHILQTINKCAE